MITVLNLAKKYEGIQALSGVSFSVEPGEIYAYLGPNGAGKTTTIRILTGLSRLEKGDAFLNGKHIEKDSVASKHEFGLVPQHLNLDNDLSLEENFLVHGLLHHMDRTKIKARTDELLDYVELSDRRKSQVKTLSGGMKRRALIARALIHEPRILFLDEPTVGLDPFIRRRIWALIRRIQADGATIFLTTHYIEEAEFLAHRVAFINGGKMVAEDTPQNLTASLGEWATDRLVEGRLQTDFFVSKSDALEHMKHVQNGGTIRRVNLEDAFIAMTGKKIS